MNKISRAGWVRYVGWLVVCVLVCAPEGSRGQAVGHFLDDTIEVGRPFQYALTVRHPVAQDVFYPDTARQFAPFLVRGVAVFPTKTQGETSLDSAVYTLISFEVSRARVLQVPVYFLNRADCTAVLATPDTVFLRSERLLTTRPDTLRLRPDVRLAPLPQEFNYTYLSLAVGALALLAAVVYILFGAVIKKTWNRSVLARRHLRFLATYDQLTSRPDPDAAGATVNTAIVNWKKYLEELDRKPYTSLTSSEIADRIGEARLTEALRETDRMIYGGSFTSQSPVALRVLREVAVAAYQRRRLQIS